MAVDTKDKRASVIGNLPAPNGGVDDGDRRQMTWWYRGLTPAVIVPDVEGIEYTCPDNRTHYTAIDSRSYYTAEGRRTHYTAEDNRTHHTADDHRTHYTAEPRQD